MLHKNSKRPFLLLEVLIALFIVVVCVSPLLSSQVFMYKIERQFLHKLEVDRVANIVFTDIIKNLYEKKEVGWSDIQENKLFTYDLLQHQSNGVPKHFPYKITYSLGMTKLRKPKIKPINFIVLLNITITPDDKSQNPNIYAYNVYLNRKLKEGQATPLDAIRDISAPSLAVEIEGIEEGDDDDDGGENEQ